MSLLWLCSLPLRDLWQYISLEMGGGGNAWMKIMGINSSEIGKRQAAKEKGAKKDGTLEG